MATNRAILRLLERHEEDLACGILPKAVASVLQHYTKAEQRMERAEADFDSATEWRTPTKGINPHVFYSGMYALGVAVRSERQIASLRGQPQYALREFAREHLILRADGHMELTPAEVEENSRRLQDYRRSLESTD